MGAHARRRGSGGAALSGEPGIGKSRILSALRERLEATGAATLRFQCSPYYVNSAFWPSIDNFERALRFGRDEPTESKLDKLEALIVSHYGRPLGDVRFVASMLSIPCEERYGALPMTPQKFKDETLRTLVDLTEAAARKQPSVMLYEDVHWADPTSLEVLDLLIDRARTIPLLIVLTHRPEFQNRWASHGHVLSLNLSKLTRAQSSALVSEVTGGKALPAALLEQILAKTDGVPLFVEELTKSILESGELKDAGDRFEYVGAAHSVTIPATLRDSLMARLDRFMPVKEIARVIEERFPNIVRTEPEVLAHHLTAASLAEAAIPLWQSAGELALKRMALTDAISHLNRGLELVSALPRSSERDASELELRIRLGTAWTALKGWAAPEVWESLHPALALAKSLRRNDALVTVLYGLSRFVMCVGRVAESMVWIEEMLATAKATGDPDLQIVGHVAACTSYFWMGELVKVLEHHDQVVALYDADTHRHLVNSLNHDPKTTVGAFASLATWMLGYPDRAVRQIDETDAHARRRAHPFDLGWALTLAADLLDHRGEPEEVRKRAEEVLRLGRESSLPFLWAVMAPARAGVALIHEGRAAQGVEMVKAPMAIWDASGGKVWNPYANSILAEGMAMTGDLDKALHLINEQIEQVERPGWEERIHYAEILRLKGWMLSLEGDLEGAEQNFLASLDWARQQQAKSWELRTSTSLARLWQAQGKRREALNLLKPVYDWFTEGFDTKDLKDAKALLDDLSK
ncbi:MAG: AAA family ATPase [Burkholderiales bacterium]